MCTRLGYDWSLFYAQAMVVRSGDGSHMYELPAINGQLQLLASHYLGTTGFQSAVQVPYPPWFAAVIEPFTVPPPPLGFAAWLALSVLAAMLLAYRVSQFLPEVRFLGAALLVLAASPVALALFMGQAPSFSAS